MSTADTASQARGIDIVAERDERRFLIEVEGYAVMTSCVATSGRATETDAADGAGTDGGCI